MRLSDLRKFMVMFALVVALTFVVQAASPKDAFVQDVALSSTGRFLEARITASESARFTYFELDGPHRLLLSIFTASKIISLSRRRTLNLLGLPAFGQVIRMAPDRTATRIVFDLDKTVDYRVIDDGAGVVRVVFDGPEADTIQVPSNLIAGPPVFPKPEEAAPVVPKIRLESLAPEVQVAALPQAGVFLSPPPAAAPATRSSGTRSAGGTSAGGPSFKWPLRRRPRSTQHANQHIDADSGAFCTGPAEPQTFNGEPIDLDLKQADFGDFFKLIGEISGLNVVVDQNVNGNVTVLLKDVPWDQALDIVLRNANLAGILEGRNVLRIATRATLQAEDAQRRAARTLPWRRFQQSAVPTFSTTRRRRTWRQPFWQAAF